MGQFTPNKADYTQIAKAIDLSALAVEVVKLTAPVPVPVNTAKLLYRADFSTMKLAPIDPAECWGLGALQRIVGGMDGGPVLMQVSDPLTVTAATVSQVMDFVVEPTGPNGQSVLRQTIYQSSAGQGPMGTSATQSAFEFHPQVDMPTVYATFQLKLQVNLVAVMADAMKSTGGAWRELICFKSGDFGTYPKDNGDCRVQLSVNAIKRSTPYWVLICDNQAGAKGQDGKLIPRVDAFNLENMDVPVPIDTWMRVEFYNKRGTDGRVVVAINNTKVFDHSGPNTGVLPLNRLMLPVLYSGSSLPIWQWTGSPYEMWDRPPATASFQV